MISNQSRCSTEGGAIAGSVSFAPAMRHLRSLTFVNQRRSRRNRSGPNVNSLTAIFAKVDRTFEDRNVLWPSALSPSDKLARFPKGDCSNAEPNDSQARWLRKARTHEGAFVHENGFQITHEERVDVQLLAQAVHRNEVEMEIEFRQVEDFDRQVAPRWMRRPQLVGLLPDTLLRIVWRFEFARVVQGRLALLMSATSFSRSSREGFWPERVRKNTGSCATSFSSLR